MIIGIGTDIIEIERIAKAIQSGKGTFKNRVFTPGEIAYCEARMNPYPSFAARFAAKEAVLKALGCGFSQVTWQQVEVARGPESTGGNGSAIEGPPQVVLRGRAAEIAEERRITKLHLSLSHDRERAIAYVVAEG